MNISEDSNDIAVPTPTKRQISTMNDRRNNKECLALERRQRYLVLREESITYQRKHYEACHDKYLGYQRHYYIEHTATIKEKQAEKFECECGGKFTRSNKLKHEKSNMHIRSLEINEIIE